MKPHSRVAGQAAELGLTMGLTAAGLLVGSLWLGRWIDRRFEVAPYATLLMLLAGLVAGQVAIFRLAMRATERLSTDAPHIWDAQAAGSAVGLALRALALVALPGGLGLVVGLQADRLMGSSPGLTLGLSLGGTILGLWGTVRMVRRSAISSKAGEE
jgi:F0F1-type ATP synthase assembly protein I